MKKLLVLTLVLVAALVAMSSCNQTDPCAKGHSYGDYVSNNDATCTVDGTKTAECTVCGEKDTVTDVGTKGHTFTNYVSNNDATCTLDGTKTATCDKCDATDTVLDVGSAAHTFTNYVSDGNFTCTADGTKTAKCDYCDATDTVTDVGSAAHIFTNYISDDNATCTEDGTKTAKCNRCDATDTIVDVGSAGHTFTNYVSDGNATCTADGTKTAKCDYCDATDTVTEEDTMLEHTLDETKYVYDADGHWFKCSGCDFVGETEAHQIFGNRCQICGYVGESVDYGDVTVMGKDRRYNFVIVDAIDKISNEAIESLALMDTLKAKGFDFYRTYMDEDIGDQEIVVGYDPSRAISRRAYDFLGRLDKESYFDMRYVVYADSGNIAIAYELNQYTDLSVLGLIFDELMAKLVGDKDYIAIDRGIVMQGSIDLIAEQAKLDEILEAEQWTTVEKNLVEKWGAEKGAELLEAFKTLYSLYDDGLVVWAANLYDPGIGGFYATASGRDHEGIYPSAETTGMALDMANSFGAPADIKTLIPDIMKYQIVYFLKSIQDPDGYFYAPGAKKSDWRAGGVAARARNLSRAESLLNAFGAKPTYDTSTGTWGDEITADEYWEDLRSRGLVNQDPPKVPKNVEDAANGVASLRDSSVVAVASIYTSVQAVADSANELNDYKLFIDWIENQNVVTGPYGAGNNIQARIQEIIKASDILERNEGKYAPAETEADKYKKYAGMNMVEMVRDHLDRNVNETTGIWGAPTEAKPNGTEFAYTNGFFKIVAVYNAIKAPVPHPAKAAEALMNGTVSAEPTSTNACDVYNIWAGITMLQTNVSSYQTDEAVTTATLNKIDELIAEYGATPIITSYNKQKNYQKEDGSFSHNTSGSAETYQGPLVVGLGYNEGDIDAIAKALWSTIAPIAKLYGATGKSGFYRHNYMEWIQIILENGPIVKYDYKEVQAGTVTYVPNTRLPGPSYAAVEAEAPIEAVAVSDAIVCVPCFNTDYTSSGKKQSYVA